MKIILSDSVLACFSDTGWRCWLALLFGNLEFNTRASAEGCRGGRRLSVERIVKGFIHQRLLSAGVECCHLATVVGSDGEEDEDEEDEEDGENDNGRGLVRLTRPRRQ